MPEDIKPALVHVKKGDQVVTIDAVEKQAWLDRGYAEITAKADIAKVDAARKASIEAAVTPVAPKDPLEVKIEAIARAVAREEIAAAVAAATPAAK